jgi:hypothetical protein
MIKETLWKFFPPMTDQEVDLKLHFEEAKLQYTIEAIKYGALRIGIFILIVIVAYMVIK